MTEYACFDIGDPSCSYQTREVAGGAAYGPAGELTSLSYYGVTETRTYNSLFQLTRITATPTGGGQTRMDMQYVYQAGQNNGRITGSVDGITGEQVTYQYDALNRLMAAQTADDSWGEAYTYDGFGNLLVKTPTKGSAPTLAMGYDPATNRPYGVSYDANGNPSPTGWSGNIWNVDNRLAWEGAFDGSVGTAFDYDPWGKRVGKSVNPGIPPEDGGRGYKDSTWEFYFYGVGGQRLATIGCGYGVNDGANPVCGVTAWNVYFGGKLIGKNDLAVATDRLGSVRVNASGGQISYFPYGEERTSTPDGTEKFGTYFRDGPGQDYADQRYYDSIKGRFWSPDPGGLATADPKNPGTWNRYAYVNGDPINFADSTGLYQYWVGDGNPFFPDQWDIIPRIGMPLCFWRPAACAPDLALLRGELADAREAGGSSGIGALRAAFLDPAVNGAKRILESDPDCAGLFGPKDVISSPGEALEEAYNNNQIRLLPFGSNVPSGVGAQTTGVDGVIQIASNRYFVTGILADGTPVNQATSPNFVGLSLAEVDQLIVIHELLHFMGIVGDDNADQQITLPNGAVVSGSTGVSNEVRKDCLHH